MHRRRLLTAAALTGTIAMPAIALQTASGEAAMPKKKASSSKTIVEVAAGDKRFSTLVKLVKSAGLAETLSTGTFTVFAPTNAAFNKVPKATLNALAKDKAKLKAVLLYHVVQGKVPASKVVTLKSATTVNGAPIKISVRGKAVTLNSKVRVTKTDIKASNGIIHTINNVLLPPSD